MGRPVLSQYYKNKNVAFVCFIGDWLESKEGVHNNLKLYFMSQQWWSSFSWFKLNTFSRCKSFTLPGPDLNTETNGKLVTGCETLNEHGGECRKSLLKLIFWKPKNSGAKFESYRQSLWMSQIINLSENCLSGSQKCISIGKQWYLRHSK